MKKLVIFLIMFFLFPKETLALSAESYIVMDMDSKRIIASQNLNKKSLIASTTKIMTTYVALTYGNLNEEVEVGEEILKAYGSSIYLQIGEKITLEKLLYGLILRSGNDASLVIAKCISKDVKSFVSLMNEMAKKIGMKNTFFLNPHGLEETDGSGNTSTVYDMALLMAEAMKNTKFKEIVKTSKITIKTSYKSYTWYNKNKLLSSYKYTTGGKTGFTKKAKRTLVTTASKDGKNLVIVTFNDGNDFNDHKNLYEKYFKMYDVYEIINKSEYKTKDTYYKNGKLFINQSFKVLLKAGELEKVKIVEEINKKDNADNNEKVGKLIIYLEEKAIHEQGIYYKKENKLSFFRVCK